MSHDWAELLKTVQLQVTSRSLDLKRELKTCGVSYLGARGEIVASHMLEVSTSLTREVCKSPSTVYSCHVISSVDELSLSNMLL